MADDSLKSGHSRRTYSKQFKAELVAQYLEGRTSLASLAVDHGMNPNVLHRWVTEHERYGKHALQDDGVPESPASLDRGATSTWVGAKQVKNPPPPGPV